jgi:hypothetical protein
LGLVTATTPSMMPLAPGMAPLLPKLRGQIAEFLNQCSLDRLGMLYLPTCVGLGYGCQDHSLETFLGSIGSPTYAITPQPCTPAGFPWRTAYTLSPRQPPRGLGYLPASSPRSPTTTRPNHRPRKGSQLVRVASALTRSQQYRNINRSSIDYAFRPRLRTRLTLGG